MPNLPAPMFFYRGFGISIGAVIFAEGIPLGQIAYLGHRNLPADYPEGMPSAKSAATLMDEIELVCHLETK